MKRARSIAQKIAKSRAGIGGEWKTARFLIVDADFSNKGSGGYDFVIRADGTGSSTNGALIKNIKVLGY